jgi:predicted ester cyclase
LTQENKAVIRRIFDEVWNKADFSLIDQVFGPDYVGHVSSAPQDVEGLEQFKQFVALHSVLASDLSFSVDDQIAEGNNVATRWTATTVPTSGLVSAPTDVQQVKVTGISIHRFADGKIVESWDNWDTLTLNQSLGADVLESVSLHI